MLRSIGIAIIFNLLLVPALRGQQENLILNGSLETYNSCPESLAVSGEINKAKFWSSGIPNGMSSTDYYHSCAGTAPSNISFHQEASDGEAFMGFGFDFVNIGREFATGSIKNCLKNGSRYKISFSVCAPFNSTYAPQGFDCFEVYFHPNQFPMGNAGSGIGGRYNEVAYAVISMNVDRPIVQQGIWHRISTEFIARGDECYFTVGCFKQISAFNYLPLDSIIPGATNLFGVLYLYDDFVLTEIPDDTTPPPAPEPVVPNVFTPNADGHNDYWAIKHLPPATSVAIYNRWGQRVYFSENYANDWGGEGLPSGTYIAELVFRDLPPKRQAVYLKR